MKRQQEGSEETTGVAIVCKPLPHTELLLLLPTATSTWFVRSYACTLMIKTSWHDVRVLNISTSVTLPKLPACDLCC